MTTGPSSETASAREAGLPPVGWREIVAVLALVVLCDITLYRSYGPAGHAALMVLAPFLFWLGSPRPRCRVSLWVISLMLAVLAARLLWCGYLLLLPVGVALLVAWALSLSGQVPHVLEAVVFGSVTQKVLASTTVPLLVIRAAKPPRRGTDCRNLRPGLAGRHGETGRPVNERVHTHAVTKRTRTYTRLILNTSGSLRSAVNSGKELLYMIR